MPEIVSYTDEKANSVKSFDLIANMMWRRANYLLEHTFKKNENILVIDPCAGGGKLLSSMKKTWIGKAYESNYGPFMYAKHYLEQNGYENVDVYNMPFEFHFSSVNLPEYHLIISIPYTNREINASIETCKECRKFKNYAYYVMNKSMEALQENGIGVFAIPSSLLDKEKFAYEIDCITNKAEVLSIEQFQDYAIITLKKDKLK
jgi:hypothetical protein